MDQDLHDLPLITPPHLVGNVALLQVIIGSVVAKFFRRNKDYPNDSNFWIPHYEVYDKAEQIADDDAMKLEQEAEYRKQISHRAIERYKKVLQE